MAKVLIVDDNEAFRRLNAEFLKMDGHQVLTARNWRETLELVREEHPEIILLDVMMPGMDGYDICRQIKNDPETAETVVVMVTALPPSERFKSFQAGAAEHVTKPIQARELRDLIKRLSRRPSREAGENT